MKIYEEITMMVARIYGVSVERVMARNREFRPTEARQVAMAACLSTSRLATTSEVGRFFRRDHTAVSHAVKKVNDLRHAYPEMDQMWWALSTEIKRIPDFNQEHLNGAHE